MSLPYLSLLASLSPTFGIVWLLLTSGSCSVGTYCYHLSDCWLFVEVKYPHNGSPVGARPGLTH